MNDIMIVDTGVANLRSMETALERAGCTTMRTRDPERVRAAGRVVLPGVGSFARGLAALEGGLDAALRERTAEGRATLAVCLGMQMLAETSDEDPGVEGLGIAPGRVERLAAARVPHLGWSPVASSEVDDWIEPGYAAFAHSYAWPISAAPALTGSGWSVAVSPSAGGFVAAMKRGGVVGCQFHPELSGRWGRVVIEDWLEMTEVSA